MTSKPVRALRTLPLGSVTPRGWLGRQLRLQADGITGQLEEIWPDVGPANGWLGGAGDDWERGPYYLDGLIPLAWLLDDAGLQAKAGKWIEWMLASGREDGQFGPASNADWWPRMVALKVLCQYADATGDERVAPFLRRYFEFQAAHLPGRPLAGWGRMRGAENVLAILWLHDREPEQWLLDLAGLLLEQTAAWEEHLRTNLPDGPTSTFDHHNHGPNVAMSLKVPAVRWLVDQDSSHRRTYDEIRKTLDTGHLLVNGVHSGDEWLAGTDPSHGTETCQVMEHAFSLEQILSIWGDAQLADELELVAFNAMAASSDARMVAHQYHQQPNQVAADINRRNWTWSRDDANMFGLEPHFGCCTANLHQGWPKFAASAWMQHADDGLTAVTYAPVAVTADLIGGRMAFDVDTEYPFEETVRITFREVPGAEAAIRLRAPAWCETPAVRVSGEDVPVSASAGYLTLRRRWSAGDVVELVLPMQVRLVERDRGAVGVRLGPLVLAYGIDEIWRPLPGARGLGEWEVTPRTSWNCGLLLDRIGEWQIERRPVGEVPFARESAPVRVVAESVRVAEWELEMNSAGRLPDSPVPTYKPVDLIDLVPYGSARVRIAEFPVVEPQGESAVSDNHGA